MSNKPVGVSLFDCWKIIFHKWFESPMKNHLWQDGIYSLLQSLDKMPSVKQVSSQPADPNAAARSKDQFMGKASDVRSQVK
jgi:hypothetical protein